jgi:hypothetical protein
VLERFGGQVTKAQMTVLFLRTPAKSGVPEDLKPGYLRG